MVAIFIIALIVAVVVFGRRAKTAADRKRAADLREKARAADKQKAAERANEVSQDRLRRAGELDPDAGNRSDPNGAGSRRDRDDDGDRRERDDDQGDEEGRRGPRS